MRFPDIAIPVFELLEPRLLLDGVTYYVDHSAAGASDSNPGTEAQPFLTVQRGVDLVQPGDTVLVKGSADPDSPDAIYDVSYQNGITPQTPGQPGQTITISAAPGQTVILQGDGSHYGIALDNASYYTFSGLVFRNFNKATEGWAAKTDILIDHCEFTITYETGLRLRNVTNFTMRDCYVHNCFEAGISVRYSDNVVFERVESSYNDDGRGADGDADGFHSIACGTLTFIDCVARGNAEDGFDLNANATLVNCVSDSNNVCNVKLWRRTEDGYAEHVYTITNSVFYGGGEAGIKVSAGAELHLYNSVIYGNGEEGVAFRANTLTVGPAVVTSTLVNNIIASNGLGAIEVLQGGTNVNDVDADHDLYYGNGRANAGLSIDTNFIANQDPLFIGAAGEDFHLQGGSPAIDAGVAIEGVTSDFDLEARPYGTTPDIGADEWMPPGSSNHTPVAADDAFSIDENSGANVLDVLANDSDPDGNLLRIIEKTNGAHGSVVILADRSAVAYTPAQGYYGPDTFTYMVSDGKGGAASAAVAITVVCINQPPVLATTGTPLTYIAGAGPVAVDPGLELSDPDSANLQGATVWISANYVSSQDALGFEDQNGITGHFDASTGILALAGTATVAQYRAALRSVTYLNSSPDPAAAVRTVSFGVSDGEAASNTASRAVVVGIAPPTVESVALNPSPLRPARTVSDIEPSGIGVRTVVIKFSKPVAFDDEAVLLETVTFNGAAQTVAWPVRGIGLAISVTGSGTDTMTITLEGTTVGYVDIWVKVTLKGDGTLTDAEGQALDGEARADGSGRGYIYSAALDLPTGDGTPGNDAVFYVGSLRGDFNGDLSVGSDDLLGFRNAWLANSLDADFRGVGFGPRPPDGRITIGDTDGFSSVYQTAIAQDIHLDPLPLSGSGLAGGVPLLPPLASTSPEVDVLAQAAGWLPSNPQAPLGASRTNDIFFSLNDEASAALLGVRRVRPVAVGAGGGLPVLRL